MIFILKGVPEEYIFVGRVAKYNIRTTHVYFLLPLFVRAFYLNWWLSLSHVQSVKKKEIRIAKGVRGMYTITYERYSM